MEGRGRVKTDFGGGGNLLDVRNSGKSQMGFQAKSQGHQRKSEGVGWGLLREWMTNIQPPGSLEYSLKEREQDVPWGSEVGTPEKGL